MKEEPAAVLVDGGGGDDDVDYGTVSFVNTAEEEMDIKYSFSVSVVPPDPTPAPVHPLETETDDDDDEPSSSPVKQVDLDLKFNWNLGSVSHLNDDGDEAQDELEEIEAIINDGDVDVQEMKPVAIPIPIIRAVDSESNENEIIIDHYKKRNPEMRTPAPPKPCICPICDTGFPSQQLFQLHMSNVHADKRPYPCSHCGKKFGKTWEREKHESIHDPNRFKGKPKFPCDMCDKRYHLKVTLEGHRKKVHLGYKPPKRSSNAVIRQHHSIGVRNHRAPKKEVTLFQCPHCDLKYGMRCLLQIHLRCHTKERPHRCEECGQTFSVSSGLTTHMRRRHLNPTSNPRPSRPAFMNKQPCPCTICGKVFPTPSRLQKHMRSHTGEKPHECSECGQRFALKQGMLKHFKRLHVVQGRKERLNPNEAYKCRICGKDDFVLYSDLRNHRIGVHRRIPLPSDSETEMPYGCGICGKPWNTRGHAMVCALLRHDPTSLHQAMFRFKCPRCPEESFGFHSTIALRRHWEEVHPDKPLPVQYRAVSGMYDNKNREDTLPSVRVNKELAKQIRERGPEVKSEFPLYIEFHLLPVEHKFYTEVRKGRPRKPEREKKLNYTCNICGNTIVHLYNLNRHMKKHAEQKLKQSYSCGVCGKKFWKLKTWMLHEQLHQDPDLGVKRPRGRPRNPSGEVSNAGCGAGEQKSRLAYPYICGLCGKGFRKSLTRKLHEQKHKTVTEKRRVGRPRKIQLGSGSEPDQSSDQVKLLLAVNVNDTEAVRNVLGGRSLSLVLDRHVVGPINGQNSVGSAASVNEEYSSQRWSSDNADGGFKKIKKDKVLKIILQRIDQIGR